VVGVEADGEGIAQRLRAIGTVEADSLDRLLAGRAEQAQLDPRVAGRLPSLGRLLHVVVLVADALAIDIDRIVAVVGRAGFRGRAEQDKASQHPSESHDLIPCSSLLTS